MRLAFSWTLFLENSALDVHIIYGWKFLLHPFNLGMLDLHLDFYLMNGMPLENFKIGSFLTKLKYVRNLISINAQTIYFQRQMSNSWSFVSLVQKNKKALRTNPSFTKLECCKYWIITDSYPFPSPSQTLMGFSCFYM